MNARQKARGIPETWRRIFGGIALLAVGTNIGMFAMQAELDFLPEVGTMDGIFGHVTFMCFSPWGPTSACTSSRWHY